MRLRHAFLALSAKGFGETILGVRLAHALAATGDEVAFLARGAATSVLGAAGFPVQVLPEHTLPLLRLYLDAFVNEFRPHTLVLADYCTTVFSFEQAGLDLAELRSFRRPIIAIDTWATHESGPTIDLFRSSRRVLPDWDRTVDLAVTPVPIAMPRDGGIYYSALPSAQRVTPKARRHVRRDLGLAEGDRAILLCTAAWQHARFRSRHGNRIARQLPQLLSHYLRRLGPRVHVVHVGPERYAMELDGCYHWLPPLRPEEFDTLVPSMDAVLTANISATTLTKAIATGIPAVVLVNSFTIATIEDLDAKIGGGISAELRAWVSATRPLYPFYLWPLGYFRFLAPVLAGNAYCDALSVVEVLREEEVHAALTHALFDASGRAQTCEAQRRYVAMVEALPSVAEQIHARVG